MPVFSASRADALRLFSLGFLTLFLELALIRFLSGGIWNLGYFPNLVLIAVFVGMGLGFMGHQFLSARGSMVAGIVAPWLLLALTAYVVFQHPTVPGFGCWAGNLGGDLYFTAVVECKDVETRYAPFVLCMGGVLAIFALISQRTAKLFRQFRPLHAYTLDISGSVAGVAVFMLVSWLTIPAWLWFVAFAVLYAAQLAGLRRAVLLAVLPGLAVAWLARYQDGVLVAMPDYAGAPETIWSPYQRLEYVDDPSKPGMHRLIFANGVPHQIMEDKVSRAGTNYQSVYDVRRALGLPAPENVLILGAGSGNDVASALDNDVRHVDAVEIDPAIPLLGKAHHPDRPYADPRVNLVIDDGRAFLARARRRYDVIVFALTDSVVKVSSMSQLRLENYLFTVESIRTAYSLLKPHGEVVFYNSYREPWVVSKIAQMMQEATGREPRGAISPSGFAVLSVGPDNLPASPQPFRLHVATDDWPFLYLKERGIPAFYAWAMLGMVGMIVLLGLFLHLATRREARYGGPGVLPTKLAFALMGAAFLLLETKGVVQFSLLFGTTWLNNSLVFLGALLLVLAANWAAYALRDPRWLWGISALLLGSAALSLVLPLGTLVVVQSGVLRFALAVLLTFSPLFFANLLFSITLRDQEVPEHVFGWNLVGATAGGVLEYTSMLIGYSQLTGIVVACYAAVLLLLLLARRAARPSAGEGRTVVGGEPRVEGGGASGALKPTTNAQEA